MPRRLLLQDACVLINLLASGRFEDIARECGYQFVAATAACDEALFIRDAATGEPVLVDLAPYLTAGLLEKIDVETEDERASYVAYATLLDDGEAMSLALAEARHLLLATDDRKARALILRESINVELSSTVGVLQAWEKAAGIEKSEMSQILARLQKCARFTPPAGHPDRVWWDARTTA